MRNTHYCDCAECREILKEKSGRVDLIILGVLVLLTGLGIFLFSKWS